MSIKEVYTIFIYKFTAINNNNEIIKNSIIVDNDEEFKEIILRERLFLISYKKKKVKNIKNNVKVKDIEIISFFNKLIILLDSGVSLIDSINNIIKSLKNEKFKKIIIEVKKELLKGKKLSSCLIKYPKIFTKTIINLITVSEISGKLSEGFKSIVEYLESEKKVKDKLFSTILYPCILLILVFLIIIVMFWIILPMYKEMFMNLKISLPKFTSFLFSLSDFVKNNSLFIVSFSFLLLVLGYLFSKSIKGKRLLDKAKIKNKLSKELYSYRIGSVFCKIIYILNQGGLPFINSLETGVENINNLYAKEQLLDSIKDIKKGVDVSRALDKSKVLPPMLIEMISIIKNDENLLETLKINYQFYDKEFEKKMNRIIVLIEPIMIILISIIIIGIMISVFIPMFSLMDNIGGM